MYFLTVSLCMLSSRAMPRMDRPLRFAFCTAFHLTVCSGVGFSGSRSGSPANSCGAVGVAAPTVTKGRRIYDEAVREALIVVWEASDRICGKRLKAVLPSLIVIGRGSVSKAGAI